CAFGWRERRSRTGGSRRRTSSTPHCAAPDERACDRHAETDGRNSSRRTDRNRTGRRRAGRVAQEAGVNFTGIKAITFDAGGTLLEPWPSVGAVYASVAVEFGFSDVSAAKLDAQFAKAWKNKEGFDYS